MQHASGRDGRAAVAPPAVEQHADELFADARRLLGNRFAEARYDNDRGLRVTAVDLDDRDVAAISAAAERLGIAGWVRTERADPTALTTWELLRHDLLILANAEPRVLDRYPSPDPGYRRPPVEIRLAAHAEATAATLHATYGAFVELYVGALPYPPTSAGTVMTDANTMAQVDPTELRVALDGALTVCSGHTTTHGLLLTNLTDQVIRLPTNGQLTAVVIDDAGRPVGGYVGAQTLALVVFTVRPSKTVRVPLVVGTAGFAPEAGYALPPGTWRLRAPIDVGGDRRLFSAPLEFTITD